MKEPFLTGAALKPASETKKGENTMETENGTQTGNNLNASPTAPAAAGKGGFAKWLSDFIDFKIMIFPYIVKILYILSLLFIYAAILFNNNTGSVAANFGILVLTFVPIAFGVHLIFEFIILQFSILDVLREVRNELRKK